MAEAPNIVTSQKSQPEDTSLQFGSKAMRDVFDLHKVRSAQIIEESKLRIATYETKFWREFYAGQQQSKAQSRIPDEMRIEVNRLWSIANAVASALYPSASRVALMPDYSGQGDVRKAQAVLNDFLVRHQSQEQILAAVTQTAVIGASGFKVTYEPGTARPADRTFLDVVPAWDMLLDESCTSIRRERYRGVKVPMPKSEVEAKYGVKGLIGRPKPQPTADLNMPNSGIGPPRMAGSPLDQGPDRAEDADGEWVDVVEFYNLVDPFRSRRGSTFLGRFELWALDQQGGPLHLRTEALPFAKTSGAPLPPLRPLIFASHPVYPYRFVSILERVMPQLIELNIFRSINAMQARRSAARIYWMVEGAVEQEQKDVATSGEDAVVFTIKADYKGDPRTAFGAVDPPKEDPATRSHIAMLNQEFTWATGQSPNSRGEITEATKYEVQAANRFTEMELKRYAIQLYAALGDTAQVVLRAIILAMQDVSDSTGGFADDAAPSTRDVADDVTLAPVGAVRAEGIVDAAAQDSPAEGNAAPVSSPAEAEARAAVQPTMPAASTANPQVAEHAVKRETGAASVVAVKPFPIRIDDTVEFVEVSDLDADFEIQFVDGVRTPLKEDARKEAQLKLTELYQQLWDRAQKGDVLARVQMETIADAFELPASWRPKSLDEATAAQTERDAKSKPPSKMQEEDDGSIEAGVPTPSAVNPAIDTLQKAKAMLEAGDLQGAARTLLPLAKSIPELEPVLSQAVEQDDPIAAMLDIVNQLLASSSDAAPAPVGAPAPLAPEAP